MNIISSQHFLRILTAFALLVSVNICILSQANNDPGSIQKNIKLSHPLNYHPAPLKDSYYNNAMFRSLLPETLTVYAVRVQFKEDNNSQTTGNGRLDLSNNYPDTVDAPAHDSLYFVNKLEFLRNYYLKASKGRLVVNFVLIPTVRNLEKEMQDYSPRRNENLQRMGSLFFDAWRSADSVYDFTGIDPQKSAFMIFHAGVGRDVDLTGFFQGELDLPSIYMGTNTLKSLYGDTTQGFYTNEGIIIPSSSMLPEQEWRIIESSFGDVFLELCMNGIVVGTFGSHLGLPDLFDTEEGTTRIGRFGLMDGQGIFNYLGVSPAEPSAWEKQYLGWVDPIVVSQNGTYTTKAATLDVNGNESVYKILVSGKEYFLVENRNRDAYNNGQTVYFIKNGVRDSIKFTQDVDGYNNSEIWRLSGSITDVDELDWGVPGIKNDTADFQGGILVWHIDENVIDAKISSNTINNDIEHKGVDVEEAKGSQDIGVVVSTPIGDLISDGFFVDFWYNGNHYRPSNIYRNEFTPTSIPNSRSYSNINSRVCITNFSQIGPSMTFTYNLCGNVANINTFPRFVGVDNSGNAQPIGIDYNLDGFDEIFVNVKDSLYGFRDNGNSIRVDMPNGFLKDSVAGTIVGFIEHNFTVPDRFIVGTYNNKISFLNFVIDTATGEPIVNERTSGSVFTSPLYIPSFFGSSKVVYVGAVGGQICRFNLDSLAFSCYMPTASSRNIIQLAEQLSTALTPIPSFINDSNKYFAESLIKPEAPQFDPASTPVIVTANNKMELLGNVISNNLGITTINSTPVIADLNNDGNQDIIFTADNKVFAVNRYGVLLDNFPFSVVGVNRISSGCAVADMNSDGINEVIFGTADGRVYAYGSNGKVLDGFPLATGGEIRSTPAIINSAGNFGLLVYSQDGYLYGYKTQWTYDSSKVIWRNFLRDKNHTNSNFESSAPVTAGPCLPSDKVYNWPNPSYGGVTNIRYFLNGDATSVKIKIMDLSGELVTTLAGTTKKGFDNEVPWDVSKVQSGIYLAVVELEGGCGETASIKIAVVK
jgi:hypothetical protein